MPSEVDGDRLAAVGDADAEMTASVVGHRIQHRRSFREVGTDHTQVRLLERMGLAMAGDRRDLGAGGQRLLRDRPATHRSAPHRGSGRLGKEVVSGWIPPLDPNPSSMRRIAVRKRSR